MAATTETTRIDCKRPRRLPSATCSLTGHLCGFRKISDPAIVCNRPADHGGEHCRMKQDDHGPKYYNVWWPQRCPECGEVAVKDHNSIRCDRCEKLWPLEYVRLEEEDRIAANVESTHPEENRNET